MSYTVRNLPPLIPTSTSTTVGIATNGVGGLDDAYAVTVWISSSANAASTNSGAPLTIQVCQFDPSLASSADGLGGEGNSVSTGYVTYQLGSTTGGIPLCSTGTAITISPVGFRGLRLINITSANLTSAGSTGLEPIAWVSKQICI